VQLESAVYFTHHCPVTLPHHWHQGWYCCILSPVFFFTGDTAGEAGSITGKAGSDSLSDIKIASSIVGTSTCSQSHTLKERVGLSGLACQVKSDTEDCN